MHRKAQPPDFRHVWLLPGHAPVVHLGLAAMGLATVGAGLWVGGHQGMALLLTLSASAVTAFSFARPERRAPPARGALEVAMAIVPWGVVVTPDTEPRVLRWPAIRRVTVDVTHSLRGGTPAILASLVTIETDREVLAGRTSGAVDLERLVVNLESYADEASRPAARDLDGVEPIDEGGTEPVAAALLREAGELCTTSGGAARLSLPSANYRAVATRLAAPETIAHLRAVLASEAHGAADPRPLAAIVAGELGARALVPDLLRLVSSPNPMVAACAKAAALRLGAPQSRAGAVDEVAAFLFDEDLELISRWAGAER